MSSLECLFVDEQYTEEACIERRKRIKISLYAYGYEFENDLLIDDHTYDKLATEIDLTIKTGNKKLDHFFEAEYTPYSGMWIRNHPELDKLKILYNRIYGR